MHNSRRSDKMDYIGFWHSIHFNSTSDQRERWRFMTPFYCRGIFVCLAVLFAEQKMSIDWISPGRRNGGFFFFQSKILLEHKSILIMRNIHNLQIHKLIFYLNANEFHTLRAQLNCNDKICICHGFKQFARAIRWIYNSFRLRDSKA